MYKIFADDTLIYDSTLDDYIIGKGQITLEPDKSGSFVFSLYPDHPYYDRFVRLRTVVTVYKGSRIVFRGRVLSDVADYWNNKVLTCEGELGFLQDSIVRPSTFNGTPAEAFRHYIEQHNAQMDEFKRFKIGQITVAGLAMDFETENHTTTFETLTGQLMSGLAQGHLYVTHGEDGQDPTPTINYLAQFTEVASQAVEFGENLKNYTKTVNAEDMVTAVIAQGGTPEGESQPVSIKKVNGGLDYVYSEAGVELYGWIFRAMTWDEILDEEELKAKAEEYLASVVNQTVTLELSAVDLHLLDRSIESFRVCQYVRVYSPPHGFNAALLCNKQTLDILHPENDSMVLGHTFTTFTETSTVALLGVTKLAGIQSSVSSLSGKLSILDDLSSTTSKNSQDIADIIVRLDALEGGGADEGGGDVIDPTT